MFWCSNNNFAMLQTSNYGLLQVDSILRANEYTHEFSVDGSVKSYDSNQLPSNNPIEDTRSEASCLLTNGSQRMTNRVLVL